MKFRFGLSLILIFLFTACRKYEEGGFNLFSLKNLVGSKQVGSSKKWKLDKYIVNGIDSTYLLPYNNDPDYYEFTFTLTNVDFGLMSIQAKFNSYAAGISFDNIAIAYKNQDPDEVDKTQCNIVNNQCEKFRSVFKPEIGYLNSRWAVKKLTSHHLVIEKETDISFYRIELIN